VDTLSNQCIPLYPFMLYSEAVQGTNPRIIPVQRALAGD